MKKSVGKELWEYIKMSIFVLIFVLIAALNILLDPLTEWMNESGGTNIELDLNNADSN